MWKQFNDAIEKQSHQKDKPTLIEVKTVIGSVLQTNLENQMFTVRHLGDDEVLLTKRNIYGY